MPALPPTPDVFHAAAARVFDLLVWGLTPYLPTHERVQAMARTHRDAIIGDLGDVLEELFVRVLTEGLGDVVGTPAVDRVTGKPVAVWDAIRDLRTRLERVERIGDEHAERLDVVVEDQRAARDPKYAPARLEDFTAGTEGAHALIFDVLAERYVADLAASDAAARAVVAALEEVGADLAGVVYPTRKDV